MPTVQSVHVPSASNSISIRGRGKKWTKLAIADVQNYATERHISFVEAFSELVNQKYNEDN